MSNFIDVTLGQKACIALSNVDKHTVVGEKKIKLCNYTDVYKNDYISSKNLKDFLVASASEEAINKFSLQIGQVAITKDSETNDDIGITTYIAETLIGVVLGYHLALITPNKNELDGKFLNYYLKNNFARKYFENNASGSGQRYTLAKDVLENIKLFLPQYETQINIGNLLYNIDRKIEFNNKINVELEKLAKTIYDYWFAQFDFPNKDGKPYKSSGGEMVYNEILKGNIPKGWGVKKIKDICNIQSGYPFNASSYVKKGYKLITIKNVQNGEIDTDVDNHIDSVPNNMADYCKLKKGDILMSLTGNVGRVALMFEDGCLLNQRVGILLPLSVNLKNYCYYLFQSDYIKIKMQNIAGGSSQDNLSPVETEEILISFDNKIAQEFSERVISMVQQMVSLKAENNDLAELRDFLLPLLMNGQVTIKEYPTKKPSVETTTKIVAVLLTLEQFKQQAGFAARGKIDEEVVQKMYEAYCVKVGENGQSKNKKHCK